MSRSDANPTTLLESAAWGLVPVCTPQCGYEDEPGFVNVPLDDVDGAVRILEELQQAPEERLLALRAANDHRLATHYTWERLTRQVADAIESGASPALAPAPVGRRLGLKLVALRSHYSPLRWRNLKMMRRRRRAARKAAAARS